MGERDTWLYDAMRGRAEEGNYPTERVHDLGSDVLITFYVSADSGDDPVGFFETHPAPDGSGCQGSVMFDVPANANQRGPKWQLLSLDPLHIEPSVLCSCGHHGFVRNGRWESC